MKIMKKLFMALVAMLIPLSAIAANATLSIEDFNIKAGETKDMVPPLKLLAAVSEMPMMASPLPAKSL